MKKRLLAIFILTVMLVSSMLYTSVSAANYTPGQIIYSDKFDGKSGYNYAATSSNTTISDLTVAINSKGQLQFTKTGAKDSDGRHYMFPYAPISGVNSFTVTYDLYVIAKSGSDTTAPLFAYGMTLDASGALNARYGGWGYNNSPIHIGYYLNGTNKNSYASIYTDESYTTKYTYDATKDSNSVYKMKLEVTNGTWPANVTVNGICYNKSAFNPASFDQAGWTDGSFGFVFRQCDTFDFAIDNLVIYAGTGVNPVDTTAASTTASGTTAAGGTTTSPKTGDSGMMIPFIALVALAAVSIPVISIRKSRKG